MMVWRDEKMNLVWMRVCVKDRDDWDIEFRRLWKWNRVFRRVDNEKWMGKRFDVFDCG